MLGDHFVDRVSDTIGRVAILHDVVELEAFDAEILDQVAGLARAIFAFARVDRGERDDDIVMLGGEFRHLVIADALRSDPALAIDREQAERDMALAIIIDRLGDGGAPPIRLEISGGRVEKLRHHRVLGVVARDFGMNMDVDRDDPAGINGHGSKS